MDFWSKARSFAEEAAKRSQELTMEAAKRSQELTSTIRLPEIVSETAKRSKEIAAEASNQIKAEALKRADLIKSISLLDPASSSEKKQQVSEKELERYGVTEELREFVKGITMSTFQDFPLQDDAPVSDVPTVSNVRQDLTEWQARHATLMLSTVKEISKLRYELCPRVMKERKFWRIYFVLVNNHIARYEKKYEEAKLKSAEQEKDDKAKETSEDAAISKPEGAKSTQPLKKATSSSEQDLDVFLLGDLGDSDDGPDDVDGDDGFDDDFDKIGDSSEDERAKDSKK